MTAQTAQVAIQPLVGWPHEAELDKSYLITVDVRLAADATWPYEQEEYPLYCALTAGLKYSIQSLGMPAVILHRFGGSYGPARFLLTTREPAEDSGLRLSLFNKWGMPILGVPLPMRIVAATERDTEATIVQLGSLRTQAESGLAATSLPVAAAPSREPEDSASTPDAAHYELVLRHLVQDGDLVPLLGSRLTEGSTESPEGRGLLPNSEDLAAELARRFGVTSARLELPEVAQYVYVMRGWPDLYRALRQILNTEYDPGPVHRFLARLPQTLEGLGLEKRYQLIVTTNFDRALEQAFDDEQEPYDLAIYMAKGPDSGKFVHVPFDRPAVTITRPNDYSDFPFTDYDELARTVIVKIHGTVDGNVGGYRWSGNYVITEDDYIAYLSGSPVESLVPSQILAKLRQSNCLFFGYTMRDWTQRVFLRRIWGDNLTTRSWAVKHSADTLEQQFWLQSGVSLYRNRLTDYIQQLDSFLRERPRS